MKIYFVVLVVGALCMEYTFGTGSLGTAGRLPMMTTRPVIYVTKSNHIIIQEVRWLPFISGGAWYFVSRHPGNEPVLILKSVMHRPKSPKKTDTRRRFSVPEIAQRGSGPSGRTPRRPQRPNLIYVPDVPNNLKQFQNISGSTASKKDDSLPAKL